jgi:beta-xylosidase
MHPRWVSLRHRPAELCTTTQRPGSLTLRASGGSLDDLDVTFVGRRQQHFSCQARTLIDPAEGHGGLAVRLDDAHYYAIETGDGRAQVIARIGPLRTVVAQREVLAGPLVLSVRIQETDTVRDSRTGPDVVSLGVEEGDGTFTALATLDGKYLSTEVAGGFTGRVIGMYAQTGTVHFDWFDYEPAQDEAEPAEG